MNKYTLGEVAEILDVTKTTIRNYEEHGLIEADRNHDNDYREFTDFDLMILREIRSFRKQGFEISEIRGMLGELTPSEMEQKVVQKRTTELARLAEILTNIQSMDALQQIIHSVNSLDQIVTESIQPCYWVPLEESRLRDTKPLSQLMPVISIGGISTISSGCEMDLGWIFKAEDASTFHIQITPRMTKLRARPCVRMITRQKESEIRVWKKHVQKMVRYAEKQELKLTGEIIMRGLITLTDEIDHEKYYYSKLYLPIADR